MPFHWISQWTGGFFEDTSLTKIGLEVHLSHADDEGDHLTEGPWIPLINDPQMTTMVDTSGLLSLMIRFCKCTDAMSPDMQLLETGLFPASFTSPKTAFIFAVLDDFLLDNLECGTLTMNYYTCSLIWFQELMRVSRQWRQVKQLKWHGFGHEKPKPKPGELALFCPACPQPGVNLNLSERNESDPVWLYSRSLVMDGNFKAEYLYPTNLSDEVALTDGLGFMANASYHKLKATEIGGCAYARHGCFVPHSMVYFQKGERKWIEESPYLDLPWGMDIIPGIGLWHVRGHQDKCYVRYASNFISSATRIDGEIMETLWVPLNIISPSMIRISKFLCRKFKEAVQGVQDSRHAFDRLSETAEDDTLVKWEAEAIAAQDDRLHNSSSMDIYEQELPLLNHQAQWPAGKIHHGAATWLACGTTLEESQVALLIDVKKLGKRPTDTQKLAVARHHDRLQGQLDEFVRVVVTFLGDELHRCDHLDSMTVMLDTAELNSIGSSCEDPDRPDDEDRYDIPVEFNPETMVIPLPSNIGIERCAQWGVADLVLQEISLKEGQANDALHAIRVNLADKAILFHTTQLIHLGADDLLTKYQPLEKADLKATTVVADPNIHGQRNNMLAWFWSIDVEGDSANNDWMNEFYRVHWLRMLALHDCWAEELLLIG
ncbi:uncharacterized protein F5147DRAFT_656156 [Suillus discolor]|uniref:CxC2-like cysteine cluster KDZ transposase-associated domain-containing protein n=1 Tax=Suillus discolor TaxID=1912936 RepID=A0A9P7EYS3_9AGAM|nr:uncharacterized protein F5147DRAFT_656156 [Suillus discolor]KAG2098276.1 hypothetical protein F5147DRAFT_656156 [Suillus discolor]